MPGLIGPPVVPSTGPQWVQLPERRIEPTRRAALTALAFAGMFVLVAAVQTALSFRMAAFVPWAVIVRRIVAVQEVAAAQTEAAAVVAAAPGVVPR